MATAQPANLTAIASHLESTMLALADLRRLLSIVPSGGRTVGGNAEEVSELHHLWTHLQLNRLDEVERLVLRPLGAKAQYLDCPGNKTSKGAHGNKGDRSDAWSKVLGDFTLTPVNVIANEEFVTVEYSTRVLPRAELQSKSKRYRLPREAFDLVGAFVVRMEGDRIAEVDHYYDFSAVLRKLGLLSKAPMGHDEPAGQPPPLVHGMGFAAGVDLQRPTRLPAGKRSIFVGSSDTPRAQANLKNCGAIHEAFVNHTPERFGELIHPDAIWIDVPTGAVLKGAVAAAHHDHGNWQSAFPDSTAVVDRLIANDDWVSVQHRGSGTHTGDLVIGGRTFAPTKRNMEIRVLDIVQYDASSRAILIRNYYDTAMMLTQLGLWGA